MLKTLEVLILIRKQIMNFYSVSFVEAALMHVSAVTRPRSNVKRNRFDYFLTI